MENVITAIGTPNIALIKYWGKRDYSINLPVNSSISITIDESLNTKTSAVFSDRFHEDRLYINKELQDWNSGNEKIMFTKNIIEHMRGLAGTKAKALIVSENSFPTASGLASSASGAVALVFATSKSLGLKLSKKEMSIVARRISGSACRSIAGGFVMWKRGRRPDGSDSYAKSIVNESHWPEIVDVITLVSSTKKKVLSSEGHKLTTETSALYRARPKSAGERVRKLTQAIKDRDFGTLAAITMADSNSMHATMLDTFPPIMYLTDVSKELIYAVHELNKNEGGPIAAYTFDAGPNAQIITLEKHKDKVVDAIKEIVGEDKIIIARQGHGPRMLSKKDSLINEDLAPVI